MLGQSFGGFCALTYLSFAPEGAARRLITGGLPPLGHTADDVYRATYDRWRHGSSASPALPEDQAVLDASPTTSRARGTAASGDPLTVPRLQQSACCSARATAREVLHYLLEGPAAGAELSDEFLDEVRRKTTFVDRPLYALLHEAIYCDGPGHARRGRRSASSTSAPSSAPDVRPLQLTGEMIYPWMFEADRPCAAGRGRAPARRAGGLAAAVRPDRLAANEVPVAAAVYHDDMYVDRLSMETAARLGACGPGSPTSTSTTGCAATRGCSTG